MSSKEGDGANVYLSFRKYISRMLDSQSGEMRILLLDEETVRMISLVYSMHEILNKEVFGTSFLFLRNSSKDKTHRDYLNAIVLIRPTKRNLYYLKQELRDPSYSKYRIYFTNTCSDEYLQELAHADKHQKIEGVYEYYADFCALGPQLFITNFAEPSKKVDAPKVASKAPVTDAQYFSPFSLQYKERTCDGLAAMLLSIRKKPYIRYSASNNGRAGQLAKMIQKRVRDDASFNFRSRTLLLILDRHDDPITPLLLQWTYQALIHDLTQNGIRFNRAVLVNKEVAYDDSGSEQRDADGKVIVNVTKDEVTMNEMTDMEFYGKQLFNPFTEVTRAYGDTARELNAMNERIDKLRQTNKIGDLQELLARLPVIKSAERTAKKHLKLLEYVTKKMDEIGLAQITKVQADIANPAIGAGAAECAKEIKDIIKSPKYEALNKLKLVMLFALRFEEKKREINDLKRMLLQHVKELKEPSVNLVNTLVEEMGEKKRVGTCFPRSGLWAAYKTLKSLGGDSLPQINPQLVGIMQELFKNKLDDTEFPFLGERTEKPDHVVVFYVGGTTYAESRVVHEVNNNCVNDKPQKYFADKSVVLGGTEVHRSITFLKYLKELRDAKFNERQ